MPPWLFVAATLLFTIGNSSDAFLALRSQQLGVTPGQTTPDGVFTLSTAECLGSCGTAPVVMVNDTYHENMSIAKIDDLLEELRKRA